MAISYGFQERLVMSEGVAGNTVVEDVIMANIPGACHVYRAHLSNDRQGTDYWVELANGNHLSVDVKSRSEDWATKPPPLRADDLALETWSVVEKRVVGWTRDAKKRTDYVLWFWQDTGRWCLIPFPMLCGVFSDKWQEWASMYKTRKQYTPGRDYHSECVFVPRKEVWAAIYRKYSGVPVLMNEVKEISL